MFSKQAGSLMFYQKSFDRQYLYNMIIEVGEQTNCDPVCIQQVLEEYLKGSYKNALIPHNHEVMHVY